MRALVRVLAREGEREWGGGGGRERGREGGGRERERRGEGVRDKGSDTESKRQRQ